MVPGYASASGQDRDAEAQQHFRAGQQLQAVGSYDAAAREYQKVIALMPEAAEAYASLGLVENAAGRYSESAAALEEAAKLKPGLRGVQLYLGIDQVKLHQAPAAIRNLREARRLEPNNKQAWLWLAAALSEAGQSAEMTDELQRASHLFPGDPEILLRMGEAYRALAETETEKVITGASGQPLVHEVYGNIYQDEGLWLKAIGHYRRALLENPQWHGAHLSLGEIALRQENPEEAEKEFQRELAIDAGSAGAHAGLAEIALLRGKAGDAVALLADAVRGAPFEASYALSLPPSPGAQQATVQDEEVALLRAELPRLSSVGASTARSLALAFVYVKLGNRDAALSSWKEFEQAVPRAAAGDGYARAASAFCRGDAGAAEEELRPWVKAKPDDLRARHLLARSYRELSLAALAELMAAAPASYPAHQLLAETYDNNEEYEKAIAEYRIVEKMAPELPGIHSALGRLLAKTGHADEAMAEFGEELRLNPDDAGANAETGALLVARGELAKGIAYLMKAVNHEPDLWPAHRELGEAYYRQKNLIPAEAELQKAVDHDPEGQASYQLGRVYQAMGRASDAKRMFARAQQISADRLADQNTPRPIPELAQP